MGRGILGSVGLLVTLVLAAHVAFVGVDFLLRGETLFGAGFLLLAGLMIAVEEYVLTPGDLPGLVAGRVVDAVVKEPDDGE
ncbi:DUF7533 family protein [Halorientalis litorea]|jgi:hypothetical protein|uniref:DUF7533 family protein n=1 Tax=Halorientalis litorea TaxID=2931977 RepID=UPI001FF6A3E3|nr:hypothetical protein [Halorientalis litorea]